MIDEEKFVDRTNIIQELGNLTPVSIVAGRNQLTDQSGSEIFPSPFQTVVDRWSNRRSYPASCFLFRFEQMLPTIFTIPWIRSGFMRRS